MRAMSIWRLRYSGVMADARAAISAPLSTYGAFSTPWAISRSPRGSKGTALPGKMAPMTAWSSPIVVISRGSVPKIQLPSRLKKYVSRGLSWPMTPCSRHSPRVCPRRSVSQSSPDRSSVSTLLKRCRDMGLSSRRVYVGSAVRLSGGALGGMALPVALLDPLVDLLGYRVPIRPRRELRQGLFLFARGQVAEQGFLGEFAPGGVSLDGHLNFLCGW